MHVLNVRNVNEALPTGLRLLAEHGREEPSRVGPVRTLPGPCTTVYQCPWERVLFWPARDANPFFHCFEALWMLGGRNDLAFPKRFNKKFDAYSDNGLTVHGAYGYRWRHRWEMDQLDGIINLLTAEPGSRRAVLQMWEPDHDLGRSSRDLPCNTNAYVRIRNGALELTVCNRSNDIIWGAYGANAVHMSMLQEYLAARLECAIGPYYQVSNDYHAYLDVYTPLMKALEQVPSVECNNLYEMRDSVIPFPLFAGDAESIDWDMDNQLFLDSPHAYGWKTAFFAMVVQPLFAAWACYEKKGDPERFDKALACVAQCQAPDWSIAAAEWLTRRADRAKAKEQPQGSMVT